MNMEFENAVPEGNMDLNQLLNSMDPAILEMLLKESEKMNAGMNAEGLVPAQMEQRPLEIAVPVPQQQEEPAPQSSNSNTTTDSSRSSKSPSPQSNVWYECFRGTQAEVSSLINTLCIFKKENTSLYECLNRRKFKCQYKFRIHVAAPDLLVCEESGYHSHTSGSTEPLPTQGAPKELKDLVDKSYYENWPTALRQQVFRAKIEELGLDMKQALRQTDNRLSYIRRTKKLTSSGNGMPNVFLPYN
ncbi:hypothetical protein L596_002518 [Steinernema carpocapsae]|uniref:FLYWCH-type domain-containing protein n=1 Tax=Steinernema carpocapsae TaxID=34508 RepID=A0A4U8UTF2_STECR|nr:hypothetical protein L596_002518 [Steinernema carpocapsae]